MKDLARKLRIDSKTARDLKRVTKTLKRESFTPENILFDKQLELLHMDGDLFAITCSRRAGKSYFVAFLLIYMAINTPDSCCLYIAQSMKSAESIIWRPLLKLLKDYEIPYKPNNQTHDIYFPNGSFIMLGGCKDDGEKEKYRGISPSPILICIDEAGHFKPFLHELIQETFRPMLMDFGAKIYMIGTPNPSCAGPFYSAVRQGKGYKDFKTFSWTFFDNYMIPQVRMGKKTHQQLLEEAVKGSGRSKDDPAVLREYFGVWIKDLNSLLFKYDSVTNGVDKVPDEFMPEAKFVLGVDTGYIDSTAFVVLAYSPHYKEAYIIKANTLNLKKGDALSVSEIIGMVKALDDAYHFNSIVFDPAAGGKNMMAELFNRYNLNATSADKKEKDQYRELLNDDLRRGTLKIVKEACVDLVHEWENLVWETKASGDRVAGTNIDGVKNDHCSDAALYGWRELTHYRSKLAIQRPEYGTEEYWKKEENDFFEAVRTRTNESIQKSNKRFLRSLMGDRRGR